MRGNIHDLMVLWEIKIPTKFGFNIIGSIPPLKKDPITEAKTLPQPKISSTRGKPNSRGDVLN